jgi:hypothetical protein
MKGIILAGGSGKVRGHPAHVPVRCAITVLTCVSDRSLH